MAIRYTEEQYKELIGKGKAENKPKKKNKYNAKKIKVDGISFDSVKEATYYKQLKILKCAGAINGFCMQPKFILAEGNEEVNGITYKADFVIFQNDGTYKIIDVKGMKTQQWKRTLKMFKLSHPKLEIVTEV